MLHEYPVTLLHNIKTEQEFEQEIIEIHKIYKSGLKWETFEEMVRKFPEELLEMLSPIIYKKASVYLEIFRLNFPEYDITENQLIQFLNYLAKYHKSVTIKDDTFSMNHTTDIKDLGLVYVVYKTLDNCSLKL